MRRIAPIHYRKLVRVLEREGFVLARESGDHMVFTKPGIERPAWFPVTTHCPYSSSRTSYAPHASRANATWNSWNQPESAKCGKSFRVPVNQPSSAGACRF